MAQTELHVRTPPWLNYHGLQTESECWRCLEVTVPDDDELGLCDWCITDLQDSPRSSRSRSSPSTSARE
jgi:hypothetical protein